MKSPDDGLKNAKSDQATNAVIFACRKKFPEKSPSAPTISYDPPGVILFSGLGMSRPNLNSLIMNLNIAESRVIQTGTNYYGVKSYDYGHHLSVDITVDDAQRNYAKATDMRRPAESSLANHFFFSQR